MDNELAGLERQYNSTKNVKDGLALVRCLRRLGQEEASFRLKSQLGYFPLVHDLPFPTNQQIEDFVCYVAGAHSWYKHLSYHEPTDFVFFLHPWASRGRNGKILTIKDKFHYNFRTTEEWDKSFGHLSFYTRYQKEEIVIDTYSDINIKIPDELLEAGTAEVTAWVYTDSRTNIFSPLEISSDGPDYNRVSRQRNELIGMKVAIERMLSTIGKYKEDMV